MVNNVTENEKSFKAEDGQLKVEGGQLNAKDKSLKMENKQPGDISKAYIPENVNAVSKLSGAVKPSQPIGSSGSSGQFDLIDDGKQINRDFGGYIEKKEGNPISRTERRSEAEVKSEPGTVLVTAIEIPLLPEEKVMIRFEYNTNDFTDKGLDSLNRC